MQVITWNLLHGRSVPERSDYLYDEFLAMIASWEWDALLLQECPPWWPKQFAAALDADYHRVLTSRNLGLPIRRAFATWRPDIVKSSGGGCNAILVRGHTIVAHRSKRISYVPERRALHAVGLNDGIWICNLHLQGTHPRHFTKPNYVAETARAGSYGMRWAGQEAPIVLGGDFNIPAPVLAGYEQIPGHRGVDQLFVRNLKFSVKAEALERGTLSDHRPIRAKIVL
jgi:endonuclease/exonuclease/phosphatase family metal-dependent hydrolase